MSDIVLERVSKWWGRTTAVDDVSVHAESGRFLVLLGPSGCGKSTMLRLIAGLEDVSAGRIFIAGDDVTDLPPSRRRISMVFQSYALFPHLSVTENIVFGLKVRKVDPEERGQRLRRVAELVGLSGLLDRKPAQLSGGQRQRVALARAIIAENSICLMDEPLSNLDAKLRHEMRLELRALQRRLGMTVVYVTHDQAEAMSMADKVVLIRDGRLEQEGTPDELYERPANAFAATFIGTPAMNLLDLARVAEAAPETDPALAALVRRWGDEGLLGMRPESVRIVSQGGVPCVVRASDYLGADTIISTELAGQSVAVRVAGRARPGEGESVRLSWEDEAAHLFDAQTGRRVPTRAGSPRAAAPGSAVRA